MIGRREEGQFLNQSNELAAQQQLVTADLTSIIIQLISIAGTLLPSFKNSSLPSNPPGGSMGNLIGSEFLSDSTKASEYEELIKDDVSLLDIKAADDDRGFFLPMNFDSCNFGGLDEFPGPAFEVSESSFSMLPGSYNYVRGNGET
ncbi:hypothetical protein J5N97_019976 [Dioscorea zingiberensis]|uniref:Uncharacterized protein n=1 Tax=Dioscorea zingiberensis TaxID=325984 RepID=A0A9D5HD81_9LILI|nr:hypothetical protein J5N97_019976 [Dioscorea zingiberensis]